MAIFITQGNYSENAMKGLVDKPEDRLGAATGLMESVGAKLLQYYVTTGEYDFLVVIEADSLNDVVSGLMVGAATGGVTNLRTVQAMTTADAMSAMERANNARAAFKSAGTS